MHLEVARQSQRTPLLGPPAPAHGPPVPAPLSCSAALFGAAVCGSRAVPRPRPYRLDSSRARAPRGGSSRQRRRAPDRASAPGALAHCPAVPAARHGSAPTPPPAPVAPRPAPPSPYRLQTKVVPASTGSASFAPLQTRWLRDAATSASGVRSGSSTTSPRATGRVSVPHPRPPRQIVAARLQLPPPLPFAV